MGASGTTIGVQRQRRRFLLAHLRRKESRAPGQSFMALRGERFWFWFWLCSPDLKNGGSLPAPDHPPPELSPALRQVLQSQADIAPFALTHDLLGPALSFCVYE